MNGPEDQSVAAVACRFIRGRNALLCAADFGPVFMDCYLHLGQNGVVLGSGVDGKLKFLLAALSLHAAAQPRSVTCAWTVHLEDAALNFFVVAENPTGQVTGQVFAEGVRSVGANVLHAESAPSGGVRRRSTVEFAGDDMLGVAEAYYAQSEQRPARFFELGGDSFAALVAQPDCDVAWLESVDVTEVEALARGDGRAPLEVRHYRFLCGCTVERIAAAIGPALRGDLEEVFGSESHIRVTCPRCGTRHEIDRGALAPPGPA